MKPIVFILGLSGVGKTSTSKALASRKSLRYIDMDRTACFERLGLPGAWDKDLRQINFGVLTRHLQNMLQEEDQGAVLDFPTEYRFDSEQIAAASAYGIFPIILWGPLDSCWESRRERQESRGKGTPSERDYRKKNEPTFELYSRGEFAGYRVQALNIDGSRPSVEQILNQIEASLTRQKRG